MSRVQRLQTADRIFFVTVNLRPALPPFRPQEFDVMLECIQESRRRLKYLYCGYVLMPDHWHALIWPCFPLTISRAVQDIKYVSSRRLNRQRESQGTLWQHQFWDRFVRHPKEFNDRFVYMHLNPVRRGLVEKPEDWRWSSCRNFSLDRNVRKSCPLQIDYVQLPTAYRG